jgi:hypothetical protein
MSDIMELIKLEWSDIHHSRNQEWKNMAFLGVTLVSLYNIKDDTIQKMILVFGLLGCILSLIMSYRHWKIFKLKVRVSDALEGKLGIFLPYRGFNSKIPVQGLIFLFYFLWASGFCGALSWFLFNKKPVTAYLTGAFVLLIGVIVFICLNNHIKKLVDKQDPVRFMDDASFLDSPYMVDGSDLSRALILNKNRPMKLVAHGLFPNERVWLQPRWSFTPKNGAIVLKDILINEKDHFQFSVADKNTHQDFHIHEYVFEIYASEKDMTIHYGAKGQQSLKGKVILVPPGICHCLTLRGITFVFQVAIGTEGIEKDKQFCCV